MTSFSKPFKAKILGLRALKLFGGDKNVTQHVSTAGPSGLTAHASHGMQKKGDLGSRMVTQHTSVAHDMAFAEKV